MTFYVTEPCISSKRELPMAAACPTPAALCQALGMVAFAEPTDFFTNSSKPELHAA